MGLHCADNFKVLRPRALRGIAAGFQAPGDYLGRTRLVDEFFPRLADVLVVMDSGKISQMGTPREVYTNPASMYVAQFVGEINRWEEDKGWRAIRPEHVVLSRWSDGEGQGGGDAAVGVVREAVYLGARVECRIDLQGTEVLAWVSDSAAISLGLVPGAQVGVTLPAEHMRWLPR